MAHTVALQPTGPGLHRPADYLVEFDIRAGEVAEDSYLAAWGPRTAALASVTGHVFLPNTGPVRATRLFGRALAWSHHDLYRIFTLRVRTRAAGNAPSLLVALSAEVSAFVAGDIDGAGFAHAEFRELGVPFRTTPWLATLGGIEVAAIRVCRCPVEMDTVF